MGPLHVPEVLIIEWLRQCLVFIFEGMNGPALAIEKWAAWRRPRQHRTHDCTGADGGVNRVAGMIDGALFVKVGGGEIKTGVSQDALLSGRILQADRSENGDGLQMRTPM